MSVLIRELKHIPDIQCLVFADNIVIISTNQNIATANMNVNKAMKILENWCDENQMIVNTEKTVYQLYTLSTKQNSTSVLYRNN